MQRGLLVAAVAVLSLSTSCGSKASTDAVASASPATSAAPTNGSASAKPSAASGPVAAPSSLPSAAAEAAPSASGVASEAPSSSAEAAAPAPPWKCGEGSFENVGTYHSGPALYAPTSRAELPGAFAWGPCTPATSGCSELDLGAASDAKVSFDLATPRGPLFIVWGGSGQCSYVLSVDLDGNVQTAMELRDPSSATIDSLAVGQGAYMAHVSIVHPGQPPAGAWLVGSAMTPPVTALAEEGEEANSAISDRLWVDATKGTLGLLGSAKSKGKFDKLPKAYVPVHGSVLALYDDGAKITVRSTVPSDADETDAITASGDHHIIAFDATPSLLAWVESSGSECVLHAGSFALTPMGRAAPRRQEGQFTLPCDGASSVAIERGAVLVGDDLVRLPDGKRVSLASTVCGAAGTAGCVRGAILGVTEKSVYFRSSGKVRRVELASIGAATGK